MLLLLAATTLSAQTILKGDMNNDNEVTIADVTSVVNVVLGKAPKETINAGGSPYLVDNSLVVGTWYAPDGTSFTLNEDGTTNFPNAATFKFRPYQGTLMLFNASGRPLKTLVLNEVETSYLLAIDYATGGIPITSTLARWLRVSRSVRPHSLYTLTTQPSSPPLFLQKEQLATSHGRAATRVWPL